MGAAIAFLVPVFTDPDDLVDLALLNAPIVVVMFVLTGALIHRHTDRHLDRTLAWIVEEREPDEREHRQTLNLATHGVKVDAAGWVAHGVLLFCVNGVAYSWGLGAVVGATIWLGAETTCALIYLALERMLRPVTARALEARLTETTVGPGIRDRLAWAWALGTGVPLLGVLVVGTVGLTKSDVDIEYVGAAVLFLSLVAYGAGAAATALRGEGDRGSGDLRPDRADEGASAATSTCASRWTTAARSACSRPASTGWPRA